MDTVYFTWLSSNPIEIDKNLELPQFTLVEDMRNDCSQNYTAGRVLEGWTVLGVVIEEVESFKG